MSTYAIGDIQGCFDALQALLVKLHFHAEHDTLWFTGDLVNRGPDSLAVLRFVKNLGSKHKVVLGNHDLHLLARAAGVRAAHRDDTLDAVLAAEDSADLIAWLRQQPLLHYDQTTQFVMTHAGLAPAWSLQQAQVLAQEVTDRLTSDDYLSFLKQMYGDQPDQWQDTLTGMDRLRCITNYLTRMRFCYTNGRLDFSYKGNLTNKPHDLIPWFQVPHRANAEINMVFGHWAALGGKADVPHVYPLDTGCVWGNALTALCLEDGRRISIPCVKS